jgi:hypothetical protein
MITNQMTPQEQYPKFYSRPEKYLGIEVETLGCRVPIKLSRGLIHDVISIDYLIPKFKPQEGEQFIKDLEDAVSCAGSFSVFYNRVKEEGNNTNYHYLYYNIGFDEDDDEDDDEGYVKCYIHKHNISKVDFSNNISGDNDFDTAAYVDRLRDLGYYL